MSNETMTDARALEVLDALHSQNYPTRDWVAAKKHIAARLRGEAAQGEQQAVATFVGVENGRRQMLWHTDDVPAGAKLYDRPQPVAVAGDAVRVTAVDAFEMGWQWRGMMDGHVHDARDVGRTLTAHFFDPLNLDLTGMDGFRTKAEGIIESKQRIHAALSAAPAAPDIAADLDFKPDEFHSIADMANVGYSLMQAIKSHRPEYCWNETPAEIVGDLLNERDEAMGTVPGGAAAPAPVAGDAVAYWLAVDSNGTVTYGLTTDDANGGAVSRQQVNDYINEADPSQRIVGVAALAQDRAPQAGAAGVPEGITPVYMICNAYESGFGKGQQGARRDSPYDKVDHKEAWLLGYDEGAKRAAESK